MYVRGANKPAQVVQQISISSDDPVQDISISRKGDVNIQRSLMRGQKSSSS